ncbi:MAG: CoA-binding protein [Pseudomonadota bacterium]
MKDARTVSLDNLFHPRSIAILGASNNPASKGYDYLKGLQEFEFPGRIYPVNPSTTRLLGLKSYPHRRDSPGEIDYVISCINAHSVIEMMDDFASKNVKTIQLYTSGFSETGDPVGKALERELVERAKQKSMRIIGPNCIGLHYPKGGVAFGRAPFSKKGGPVGAIVQSGGHAWHLVSSGSLRGLGFSKIVSFGNAADLDETDFLEYLTLDRETEVIVAYLEGIKDGRRFTEAARKVARVKPLIMFKGGRTDAGKRAAASHTGSIAGSKKVWNAFFRQTGIIRAFSIDDIIDFVLPFLHFPAIEGSHVGVVGSGGGASVQAADDLESVGFTIPSLPADIKEKLKEFTPIAGSSLENPVDTVELRNPRNFIQTIGLVGSWKEIDILLAHAVVELTSQWQGQSVLDGIVDGLIKIKEVVGKPMTVVLQSYGTAKGAANLYQIRKRLADSGIPVYPTVVRAAKAIDQFVRYHRNHRGM